MFSNATLLQKEVTMHLKRYLFENNISQKDFAEQIGYTRNYINMIVNDRLKPFRPLALAIEKATNGAVCFESQEKQLPK
jgi:transcriptional regulator with XRE-family HTH domain